MSRFPNRRPALLILPFSKVRVASALEILLQEESTPVLESMRGSLSQAFKTTHFEKGEEARAFTFSEGLEHLGVPAFLTSCGATSEKQSAMLYSTRQQLFLQTDGSGWAMLPLSWAVQETLCVMGIFCPFSCQKSSLATAVVLCQRRIVHTRSSGEHQTKKPAVGRPATADYPIILTVLIARELICLRRGDEGQMSDKHASFE